MTPTGKWLAGCGVGCGVLLLGGIGAAVVGVLYVRHTFRGIEKATTSYERLVADLGTVEDFVPPADGVPSAERLEVFLAVRADTAAARHEVEALLARRPPPELAEGDAVVKIQAGFHLLGDFVDGVGTYLEARNHAMIARGMGVGEYVYLYTLAYHSWLGHPPAEAPEPREGPDAVRVEVFEGDALFGEAVVRRRYRRYVLGMLRRQIQSLGRGPESEPGSWRGQLKQEAHRMEVDPGRVLWQEGLPSAIEAALGPFRARLAAHWSAGTNRFELPLNEHETPWRWRIEAPPDG